VTPRANDEYNAEIRKRLDNSLFMQYMSWYRTGGNGKVSNVFPGCVVWLYICVMGFMCLWMSICAAQVRYFDVVVVEATCLGSLYGDEWSAVAEGA
jgi:hypothetical protein